MVLMTCPSTLHPLESMDKRLKEFVHLNHLDLSRTINYQVNQFHDHIHISELSKQLSSLHLTVKQVFSIITDIQLFHLSFVLHV